MKKIILIAVFSLVQLISFSQENLKVIYVNNTRSTREDVISDMMYDKIGKMFDKIKADKEPFVLFLSNGTNFEITTNPESLDKMLTTMSNSNSMVADQLYDIDKMRNSVYDKIAKITGDISFDFFIIGDMAGNIPFRASPLFKNFPEEISAMFNNKKVSVTINSPAESTKVKAEQIKSALTFYSTDFGQENVTFNALTL